MLIDRKTARKKFEETITSYSDWIYLIGESKTGKTKFIKEILEDKFYVYCEPTHNFKYWQVFFNHIAIYSKDILINYFNETGDGFNNYTSKFAAEMSLYEFKNILEDQIRNEIKNEGNNIAKFLGKFLTEKYQYIILDNLYNCDMASYEWLVQILDIFGKDNNHYIVVICDTDKEWFNSDLKSIFTNQVSKIKIDKYDNDQAYYDLINNDMHFDNSEILANLSKELYSNFKGESKKIFQLLTLLECEDIAKLSDEGKKELIIEKASYLSLKTLEKLNYCSKQILIVLAVSPINLSANILAEILNIKNEVIMEAISVCQEKGLITFFYNKKNNQTEYALTDVFSRNTYMKKSKENELDYYRKRILTLYKQKEIEIDDALMVELSLKFKPDDLFDLIGSYIIDISLTDTDSENKVKALNDFINITNEIPLELCNMNNVDLLYHFGYYNSSYKIITHINNLEDDYAYLMRKGDIQHLTLHRDTAKTFEKAANLKNISISQKLSAINRQIMALTQEKEKELSYARQLYTVTIEKYERSKCNGLIELYRNANNVFEYEEALDYTIKGYNLSVELNNDMEKIKTLHNICMLKLLNGNYYQALNRKDLNIEPNFEMICHEFESSNEFRHELSYPLLDLGTLEMFKYVEFSNKENLIQAKQYFSRAQLYAKSFYARNIAETSLLIANSYLCDEKNYIISARQRLFNKYQLKAHEIKDFRVHRKILLSLATSASITNDIEEGKKYLLLSKEHIFEGETLRYNNLCDDLMVPSEKILYNPQKASNIKAYHESSRFVPWLISFGH